MRKQRILLIVFFVIATLCVGHLALAQNSIGQLGLEYGTATGLATADIRLVVARIVRAFLGLLGIITVTLIIYAGYLWMTAAGEEEKIEKAKDILLNSTIGLAIILSAFAITQFVISRLTSATLGLPEEGAGGRTVTEISPLSNSLGAGIIREHYPARDATGIPRNAKIIITFKEPMSIPSIIKNYDDKGTPENLSDDVATKNTNGTADTADDYYELNGDVIKIYPSDRSEGAAVPQDKIKVSFTPDLKTWVFDPIPLLGTPSKEVLYSVELKGGRTGIRRINGEPAFNGVYSSGYTWEFQVSTFIDNTPPHVTSVVPVQSRECRSGVCARNIIISVNFDEAIDPTSVSGVAPGFTNLSMSAGNGGTTSTVAGTFTITNQYQTVEFAPSEHCGTNACGNDVLCLPSLSNITVTLRAATLSAEPPAAALPYPFDGVTDVVGNSLDGNVNGHAEGSPTDNYAWSFSTSDVVDLTSPAIIDIDPAPNTADVKALYSVHIAFSKEMRVSTLTNDSVNFYGANSNGTLDKSVTPWYDLRNQAAFWPSRELLEDLTPAESAAVHEPLITYSELRHGPFMVNTSYYPEVTSAVQDIYQNCFYPPNNSPVPPQSLQCQTTSNQPYCCAGATGPATCNVPCQLSASGNPVCPTPTN